MNYRHFGSCGHKEYIAGIPEPRRFVCWGEISIGPRMRNHDVKTIVEMSMIKDSTYIHNFVQYRPSNVFWTCNTNRKRVAYGGTDRTYPHDVVQLNHYRAQSYEEFMIHDMKPRPGLGGNPKPRSRKAAEYRFSRHDNNTLYDFQAYNFWNERVETFDFS